MSNLLPSDGQYTGIYTTSVGTTFVEVTSADFADVASNVQGTMLPDDLVFTSLTIEDTHGTQTVLVGYGPAGDRDDTTNMLRVRPLTTASWSVRGQLVDGGPVTTLTLGGSGAGTTLLVTATFTRSAI